MVDRYLTTLRRAIRKAKRFVGRIVYVVRDILGKPHFTLGNSVRGSLLFMCSAGLDGTLVVLRHP